MSFIADGFAAWRECRQAFDDLLHSQYQLAEDRTNGALLNERGRQAGIDPWRLFTSNLSFRNAYASEELQDHWRDHPHTTYAAFEKQWAEAQESETETVDPEHPVCKHCGQGVHPARTGWHHDNGYLSCYWTPGFSSSFTDDPHADVDGIEKPAVDRDEHCDWILS